MYFSLFLLFFDFRLLVDLLNGFRTLIGSSGHPVVLKEEQNTGPAHVFRTFCGDTQFTVKISFTGGLWQHEWNMKISVRENI